MCSSRVVAFDAGPRTHFAAVRGAAGAAVTCVILPGSGAVDFDGLFGPNRPLRELGDALAEDGCKVVRLSKIPYGAPFEPRSYVEEYVEPVQGAIDACDARDDRLIVIGHSLGGHVAPLVASYIKEVSGVVLLNPGVRSLPTIATSQIRRQKLSSKIKCLPMPASYMDAAERYDFSEAVRALTVPLLAISCGNDNILPPCERRMLRRAIRGACDAQWYACGPANHLGMVSFAGNSVSEEQPGMLSRRISRRISAWLPNTITRE